MMTEETTPARQRSDDLPAAGPQERNDEMAGALLGSRIETMSLPGGKWLLILHGAGAEVSEAKLDELTTQTGAAAVLVFDHWVAVVGADPLIGRTDDELIEAMGGAAELRRRLADAVGMVGYDTPPDSDEITDAVEILVRDADRLRGEVGSLARTLAEVQHVTDMLPTFPSPNEAQRALYELVGVPDESDPLSRPKTAHLPFGWPR